MQKGRKSAYLLLFLAFWALSNVNAQFEFTTSTFIYSPLPADFNNLTQKGDINFSVASGSLYNIKWPNIKVAYSPINNISLGVSLFSVFSSNSRFPENESKIFSADIGYYMTKTASEKVSFIHEFGIGYGQGSVQSRYNSSGTANLGIQRYFLNAMTTIKLKKIGIGLGVKPSFINFFNKDGFGDVPALEIEKLTYVIANSPAVFLDFNFRLEFGPEFTKFFFGMDRSFLGVKESTDFTPDYFDNQTTTIGVYVSVNNAIKNLKKKS